MEKLIEIEELEYEYSDGTKALKGIDFCIHRGEKLAILGSNGAGKSSFFLTLNGINKPSKGKVLYKNEPVQYNKRYLQKLRKNVGIVFQDPDNQIFAPTVYTEVAFGPLNLGDTEEEVIKKVDEVLINLNIEKLKEKTPHYLSGGQKKKVTIADVLVMDPELIIFDEPTASLDPCNSKNLYRILEQLHALGKTIILSTHDMDFAYSWADRIVVFHDGRIIGDNNPYKIFNDDNLIEESKLCKPKIFEIYKELSKYNLINETECYPKTLEELKLVISKDKWRNIYNI